VATPFESILTQSYELASDRLSETVAAMLDKADEALTAMLGETQSTETQELYRRTRDGVIANRAAFEKDFRARYGKEFQTRSKKASKVAQSINDIDLSDMELELVGEDDLTETLKFNEMAAKVRRICDEELVALDQRVGVLLGDADLQPDDSPFNPQVVLDAYRHACKQVDGEIAGRMVLLRLFDDHVVDGLRPIYKDVNALLVKNSILPKIRYGVSKKDGKKPPAPGEPAAADAAAPSEQDFFAMMQNFMKASGTLPAGAGAGGPGGGQVVVLQGAELLSSLSRLQAGGGAAAGGPGGELPVLNLGEGGTNNVLRELKSTSVGASMGQMDAMTLDIVAMIFDQLFEEPKIPLAVKGLIGRMQIPVLKVAIADKAFFSNNAHPARKMLDALGEIAVRLPADFSSGSPLFAQLEKIVDEVLAGFKDNVEIFDTVREKLHGLMVEEDKLLAQATQAAAQRIQAEENLALARTVAQNEIKERLKGKVSSGRVPRFVVDFLVRHWIKFLLLVHAKRGKDSDVWRSSLEVMDQLIWSVEPKETLEDKRKLATVVPPMLKKMQAGLKGAGIDQAAVASFMDGLMKRHTEIVSNEEAPASAAPATSGDPNRTMPGGPSSKQATDPNRTMPGGPSSKQPADPNRTMPGGPSSRLADPNRTMPGGPSSKVADPNRTMPGGPSSKQPARPAPAKVAEADLDFTDDLTVKNPFGGGEVQVKQLDFTDLPWATPAQARIAAKEAELTDHLVEGAWVEVKVKDEKDQVEARAARLSYVSPMKTSYLFKDRNGKTVLECSRAELARRYRLKEVADMDEAPLFDRIMTGLVGKMKAGPASAKSA
jgi:hypothetical protein